MAGIHPPRYRRVRRTESLPILISDDDAVHQCGQISCRVENPRGVLTLTSRRHEYPRRGLPQDERHLSRSVDRHDGSRTAPLSHAAAWATRHSRQFGSCTATTSPGWTPSPCRLAATRRLSSYSCPTVATSPRFSLCSTTEVSAPAAAAAWRTSGSVVASPPHPTSACQPHAVSHVPQARTLEPRC